MEFYPVAIEKLIEEFAKLPSIGQKTAQRLKISIVRKPKPLKRSKRRSKLGCKPKPTSTKPWQLSKIDDETTHHIHAHLFVFGGRRMP